VQVGGIPSHEETVEDKVPYSEENAKNHSASSERQSGVGGTKKSNEEGAQGRGLSSENAPLRKTGGQRNYNGRWVGPGKKAEKITVGMAGG